MPVVEPWALICPPVIGGADAALERTEGGVVLVLTASGGMAEDIDQRVRQLAESLGATLPRARASVSTVDGGARLVLEVVDRKEASLLGDEVAAVFQRMVSGGCPPLPTRPQAERPAPAVQQPSGHHH